MINQAPAPTDSSGATDFARAPVPGLSFVSVDTETTGTDPREARVIELGLVAFEDGLPQRPRRRLFNPGVPIPTGASDVHGLYDHHVAHCPPFGAYPHLRPLMQSDRLAGYNLLDYDGPVLAAEAARHLGEQLPAPGGVDVLVFVRWHLRHRRDRKLVDLCTFYGIELVAAHSAAADALAAGEVLVAMVRQGLIPERREDQLRVQAEVLPQLRAEQEHWTYHIYRDRKDGALMLGYGKLCGWPLDDTSKVQSFLSWCLDNHDRAAARLAAGQPLSQQDRLLPPAVEYEFRRRLPTQRAPRTQLGFGLGGGRAGLHAGGG